MLEDTDGSSMERQTMEQVRPRTVHFKCTPSCYTAGKPLKS